MRRSSWTVIASTGEQFRGFEPYVASVNDAGLVAFQASLPGGGSGVFAGSGTEVVELAAPDALAEVTSHPDVNLAGMTSFYGEPPGGGEAAFLLRGGTLETISDAPGRFLSIGPLGPTMNEAGTVAFRAESAADVSGVYLGDAQGVSTVAQTDGEWTRFHGLPVIDRSGCVTFRADRAHGVEGIYVGRDGTIRTVAETGDVFESLALFPSANDHGTIALAATLRDGGAAIVTVDDGRVTVVDTDVAFESFRGALIGGEGAVVRIGTPRGGSLGLFSGPDPEADRILAIGDHLLESTVADLAANPVSINSFGQLAIRASLADGRQVILRGDPGD